MDCLRSFNFALANQSNYDASLGFKYWQINSQHYWLIDQSLPNVKYLVQGFKNINVFKIEVSGDVNSSPAFVPYEALVQNWKWDLQVVGQNSTNVGILAPAQNPGYMVIQETNPSFRLSKFQPSIEFETPIQSAKEIIFTNFYCDGIANKTTTSAQVGFVINVTVFYKYEGE
jgi:hypothetical protein